jgi:hypothetical protein
MTNNSIGVIHVGTISVDFTNVDMSSFRRRTMATGIEYRLEYQVGVDFRSDEGVLRCFSLADGRTIGVTRINFKDIAG